LHRSNVTVLEERRLIPTDIINAIIRPFLESRKAPFMVLPEYISLPSEEPQEIIISSCYYKSYDWYGEVKKFLKLIAEGDKDTRAMFLDYLILLKHRIKTPKQMAKEKDTLMTPLVFLMEYGNIPYGASALAFYKLHFFKRNINRAWRPIRDISYLTKTKNVYNIPKVANEIRIMGLDIAMRAGKANDNTIIALARLLPTLKGWKTEVVYLESHHGKNTVLQALRIKQIFEEFQCDIISMDVGNAGISVFDVMTSITKDELRGIDYEPYTVMNSNLVDSVVYDKLTARTLGDEANACVFPISGTAELNSDIAVSLRDRLKRGMITFLTDENTEETFLIKRKDENILNQDDISLRPYLLQANVQTSLMINECISLEMAMKGARGLVKLEEPSGGRKDRFSAISYLNYYVSLMDIELLKKDGNEKDDEEAFRGVSLIV